MWILYLMLFVAPPGPPHTSESKKVWTLQSTTTMEFGSDTLCKRAYSDIFNSIANTDTVTARAWCFPKSATSKITITDDKLILQEKSAPATIQLPTKR